MFDVAADVQAAAEESAAAPGHNAGWGGRWSSARMTRSGGVNFALLGNMLRTFVWADVCLVALFFLVTKRKFALEP